MGKFILQESEKEQIRKMYGLINEQITESEYDMLQRRQQTYPQQSYNGARQLGYNEIGDGVIRNPTSSIISDDNTPLPKIDLPDGTYVGYGFEPHPMGISIPNPDNPKQSLNNQGNTFLILKPGGDKFPYGGETGYLVISNHPTNIDTRNDVVTIKDGVAKSNMWGSDFYKILYKQQR
jgi:hypothetical protein